MFLCARLLVELHFACRNADGELMLVSLIGGPGGRKRKRKSVRGLVQYPLSPESIRRRWLIRNSWKPPQASNNGCSRYPRIHTISHLGNWAAHDLALFPQQLLVRYERSRLRPQGRSTNTWDAVMASGSAPFEEPDIRPLVQTLPLTMIRRARDAETMRPKNPQLVSGIGLNSGPASGATWDRLEVWYNALGDTVNLSRDWNS